MTSKHCFSKIMKEDFRHKIWMLALSILGNLLALPVAFLIYTGNTYKYYESDAQRILRSAGAVCDFFASTLCITGGIIAIAGALIVGLAGFRYVFHRNMVDTYHSIPVKRRTLFVASWLNGFLIWFVPFIINLVITMILGVGKLGSLRASFYQASDKTPEITEAFAGLSVGDIFGEGLLSAVALTVSFLLVYHLILLAVMFSGNVLNALVLTGVAGAGAISLYALWVCFEGYYLDTFFANMPFVQEKMVYASPLASACYLLYERVQAHYGEAGAGVWILVNLVIALLLGLAAALVYEKRPSELAEQGVKNKPVRFVVQIAMTFAAGMGGWLLFYAIVSDISSVKSACAWGIFGGLLGAVLVFGVLDIIFRMDFKAFFTHKIWMAATTVAVLLLCLGFCFDWVGYDAYLPEKDKIAEMSVVAPCRNNMNNYYGYETELMSKTHLTDVDTVYAFLESATAYYRNGGHSAEAPQEQTFRSENIRVKVTLESGRSYYRNYRVYSYDNEAASKLLSSREYLDAFYKIDENAVENATGITLRRNGRSKDLKKGEDISEEEMLKICRAYNQDMEEQPETFINGGGRVLAMITLENTLKVSDRRFLMLYEEMNHTRETLRECGYEFFTETIAAEEVEEIRIYSDVWADELEESGNVNLVDRVRDFYEVYESEETKEESGTDTVADIKAVRTESTVQLPSGDEDDRRIYVSVTDEAEITELLELVSYYEGNYISGAFQKELVGNLMIITKDGHEWGTFVFEGALPEKYISRFGE